MHIELADFAIAAVVVAAIVTARRSGIGVVSRSWWLWGAIAALLVWIFASVAIRIAAGQPYPWQTHFVTALKFAEYALLAPAFALLVRRRRELDIVLKTVVLWSAVATAVGVLEFCGIKIFMYGATGGRQGSFVSVSDFAALSAASFLAGLVEFATGTQRPTRPLALLGLVGGGIGLVLAGAVASIAGVVLGTVVVAAIVLARRPERRARLAMLAGAVVVIALATGAMRSGDLSQYARFLLAQKRETKTTAVQTYAHRTLLAYIGLRIFEDHPVLGAGWQASQDPETFERYLPAAHARFPDEPAVAFPSRKHAWGVQNLYVQALADLGVIGLGLFVAVFLTAAVLGLRAAMRERAAPTAAVIGTTWLLASVVMWAAQGIVAGIPLDALTWMAAGLVAAAARERA